MKYLDLLEREDMYAALKKRFSEDELYELISYSLEKKIFKLDEELNPLLSQRKAMFDSGLLTWPFPQEYVALDKKCNELYDQIFSLHSLDSEVRFMRNHIGDHRSYEEIKADELAEEKAKKEKDKEKNKAFWDKYFDKMKEKYG